jgi:hypothetical protein
LFQFANLNSLCFHCLVLKLEQGLVLVILAQELGQQTEELELGRRIEELELELVILVQELGWNHSYMAQLDIQHHNNRRSSHTIPIVTGT